MLVDAMTLTTKAIKRQLDAVFLDLVDWNPTDQEYQVVQWDDIPGLVERFPASPWIEHKWECEEIAKAFVVDVRRWEAGDADAHLNRAIGVCNCERLRGQDIAHTINVLLTDRGVALLDMQTKDFWLAECGADTIYFVEM
jgi:hypothetical protein